MAPQITRISIVFGGIVLLFLSLRSQLVPTGFGEDGFHRAQGPGLVASSPIRHAGMKACLECHPDKAEGTPHVAKGVHCESCHRAAANHAEDPDKAKPFVPEERADCTQCHASIVSRPAWYPQIDPKTHNPESKCIACHTVHEGTDGTKSDEEVKK